VLLRESTVALIGLLRLIALLASANLDVVHGC
jgi:hypothetical protein